MIIRKRLIISLWISVKNLKVRNSIEFVCLQCELSFRSWVYRYVKSDFWRVFIGTKHRETREKFFKFSRQLVKAPVCSSLDECLDCFGLAIRNTLSTSGSWNCFVQIWGFDNGADVASRIRMGTRNWSRERERERESRDRQQNMITIPSPISIF